ncbi:MAG: type II toxin-antitoxin system Phd/YefM family antitoxin [Anaerolineales bacterium]|nr:type II toxin-antitoxin system Phd/YefM family antitoxin [Anaerolineales bacterium]
MRQISLSEVKDQLSRYIREAAKEEIIIMRHGKPAGVLIGFESEDEWFDYRIEHDPAFRARIARARQQLMIGQGVALEDAFPGEPG